MRSQIFTWGLGLALLAGVPAASEEEGERRAPGRAPGLDARAMLHGELALSLRDAIAMGIENNLDVEIERFTPLIADQGVTAAWGAYDPRLGADFGYQSEQTPNSFALTGLAILDTRTWEGNSGLTGLIPKLGASYGLNYNGTRTEDTAQFQALRPSWRANWTVEATMPLMKGFLWGQEWVAVKTSQVSSASALEDFRTRLMDTTQEIEVAYWELDATEEQLRVADKSVETAGALLEQVEAQYEVGVESRVAVVEAEAGLAEREFERIRADNAYQSAQDALIDLILGENLRADSRLQIRPADSPDPVVYEVDREEAARKAFQYRPELAKQRQEIERREFELKGAENSRLPQLDVTGSFGMSGLAGRVQPVLNPNPDPTDPSTRFITPPPLNNNFHSAHDDMFTDRGAESWSLGAKFSIPLGNRKGRADARIAAFELRRAQTRLIRVEQDVILEVRQAVRDLRSAQEGIEAAERQRVSAEEQLRAETIRLEHGESTPFDVLEREERLVRAEVNKIDALRVYRDSITGLDRAQGTILRDRGIRVDDARALR